MRKFLLKVNGERHCPNKVARPRKPEEWEGGAVLIPSEGPKVRQGGAWVAAAPPELGDHLWIWCHEGRDYGHGQGMTARATVAGLGQRDEFLAVTLQDVQILRPAFGFETIGRRPTGSDLLDAVEAFRWHRAYLMGEEDEADFLKIWSDRHAKLEEIARNEPMSEWARAIAARRNTLAADITARFDLRRARPDQPRFRREVLERYGWRCLLTGNPVEAVLEAAHVLPHNGDPLWDRADNGVCLRRDVHALFDRLLWSIEPATGRIRLSMSLRGEARREFPYARLEGRIVPHKIPMDILREHYRLFEREETMRRPGGTGRLS